jgi:hypothetical protein
MFRILDGCALFSSRTRTISMESHRYIEKKKSLVSLWIGLYHTLGQSTLFMRQHNEQSRKVRALKTMYRKKSMKINFHVPWEKRRESGAKSFYIILSKWKFVFQSVSSHCILGWIIFGNFVEIVSSFYRKTIFIHKLTKNRISVISAGLES